MSEELGVSVQWMARFQMANEQNRSILHSYVEKHRVNDVRRLLDDRAFKGKFLNAQDRDGFSPLHLGKRRRTRYIDSALFFSSSVHER